MVDVRNVESCSGGRRTFLRGSCDDGPDGVSSATHQACVSQNPLASLSLSPTTCCAIIRIKYKDLYNCSALKRWTIIYLQSRMLEGELQEPGQFMSTPVNELLSHGQTHSAQHDEASVFVAMYNSSTSISSFQFIHVILYILHALGSTCANHNERRSSQSHLSQPLMLYSPNPTVQT